MAHNARVRAPGTWASLTTVSPSEFELFDGYTFSAINGDAGGTWAPADEIVIGGLGLTVTGPSDLDDCRGIAMTNSGFISFNSEVANTLAIQLNSFRTLDLSGSAKIRLTGTAVHSFATGTSLTMAAGSSLTMAAGSTAAMQGTFNVSGAGLLNIATDGFFLCQANLATSGPLVRTNALARHRHSGRTLSVTDTDTLAGVEYDQITMTVTGGVGITLTLKVTTAPTPTRGERIIIRKEGTGGGGLVVQSEGLAGTVVQWVAANQGSTELWYDGTRWRALAQPVNGVLGPGA